MGVKHNAIMKFIQERAKKTGSKSWMLTALLESLQCDCALGSEMFMVTVLASLTIGDTAKALGKKKLCDTVYLAMTPAT